MTDVWHEVVSCPNQSLIPTPAVYSRILALIMEGANHPGTSKVLAMSETRARLVMWSVFCRE